MFGDAPGLSLSMSRDDNFKLGADRFDPRRLEVGCTAFPGGSRAWARTERFLVWTGD